MPLIGLNLREGRIPFRITASAGDCTTIKGATCGFDRLMCVQYLFPVRSVIRLIAAADAIEKPGTVQISNEDSCSHVRCENETVSSFGTVRK